MSQFWSPVVHTLTPYVPGEQPKLQNLVKLNTNENPYGPSPRVIAALQREAAAASTKCDALDFHDVNRFTGEHLNEVLEGSRIEVAHRDGG